MNFDSPFSRSERPSAVAQCKSACVAKRRKDDTLSSAVQKRIKALTGRTEPATGREPGDDGPVMMSADDSPCQRQANQLGSTLRRFNRYREALPFAEAANDMAVIKKKRKPEKPLVAAQPKPDTCLERLSTNADELCAQLNLPKGAITQGDLRDDDTGFLGALYRDNGSGKLILVGNDTDASSLIDWRTNLENADGIETKQYKAARQLAKKLKLSHIDYDIAGYSKSGGMGQLMGLTNDKARVFVFNSAGLPDNGNYGSSADLAGLTDRTQSFSADGDILTYMNETTDPAKLIENAEFLEKELLGEGSGYNPMKVKYRDPAHPDAMHDPEFAESMQDLEALMDKQIKELRKSGKAPPPVRAWHKETVKNSDSGFANTFGAKKEHPNFGKQYQHQMGQVLGPLKENVDTDKKSLDDFLKKCG